MKLLLLVKEQDSHWELEYEKEHPEEDNFQDEPSVAGVLDSAALLTVCAESCIVDVDERCDAVETGQSRCVPYVHHIDADEDDRQ